jgi:outer membrane protein assembly factor BamB/actin-like ATPase involved in cell morphogenesis
VSYGLGVDLGTTHTAAAVLAGGRTEVLRLGARRPEIPSLVFLRPDGEVLVGEAAERRGAAEPARLAREFKRRVGDPVPQLVGGTPYAAHVLMAKLLRHVLDIAAREQDGPPSSVALTHPANWGPYKLDLLRQAVQLAEVDGVLLRSEPAAAAIHYAIGERIRSAEVVAVYDLGGGTFDAAVLRKTADGFTLLGEPEGIEQLGGIDFDEAVFGHVTATLGAEAQRLDPDDEEVTAALARLRRDCVEAKEALSFDTEVMIPVALPGLHTRVRLNRSEFEAMIRPALAETVAATARALRSAGVAADDLRALVLAGGSARIPLVGQLLGTEFDRPVVRDPAPEHSIALGAAATTGPVTPSAAPAASAPVAAAPVAAAPVAAAPVAAAPARPAAAPATPPTTAATPVTAAAAGRPAWAPALTAHLRRSAGPLWASAARMSPRSRLAICAVTAAVLVGVPAAVLAWPDSGPPAGSGDQAPRQTPVAAAQPRLLWSYTAGGPVTGSPALADGTVYIGSADGSVHALDQADGRLVWRFSAGSPVLAPQARDGVVYAASRDGWVYAIGAADGTLRWRVRAGQAVSSSPAVAGETVYIGSDDNAVYAFSLAGRRRWRAGTSGPVPTTPAVAGGIVYAGAADGRLYALDAASGQRRWSAPVDATPFSTVAAPGAVFAGTADGTGHALEAGTGERRWRFPAAAPVSGAAVAGDTVYFGSSAGTVHAVDAATGTERWRFTVDGGAPVTAPVPAGGTVYLAGAGRIYALDAATGEKRFEYPTPTAVTGPPRVGDGVLYAGGEDGRVYALQLPPGLGVVGDPATPLADPSESASPSRPPSPRGGERPPGRRSPSPVPSRSPSPGPASPRPPPSGPPSTTGTPATTPPAVATPAVATPAVATPAVADAPARPS